MAEGSKVHLVRCPKCENLLPELPDYSIYQCGSCGVLLRAKKNLVVKERNRKGFEKLEVLSETEKESNGIFLDRRKDRIFEERSNLVIDYLLETSTSSSNRNVKEQIVGYNDKYRLPLKHPTGNWIGCDDYQISTNRSESSNSNRRKCIGNISGQFEGSAGSLRSKAIVNNWHFDIDGQGDPHGNERKLSSFAYPGEEPSNTYLSSSSYGRGSEVKYFDDADGPNRFAHLEQNRAELLRKLDELKEQIWGSGSVVDKQKEGAAPFNLKIAPPGAYHGHVTCNPDKHIMKPPYFKQYGHDMGMKKFHFPPKHGVDEFPVHSDPVHLRVARVSSHQSPGQCMGFHHEQLISYPQRKLYDEHAAGACIHCYNKNCQVLSKFPFDSNFNSHVNPATIGSNNCRPQTTYSPLQSKDAKSYYRSPSYTDSVMNIFHKSSVAKMEVAYRKARLCHPIASGAPFIACYSCFELLKLPRKLKAKEKNQHKLRCGACSTVFLLEIKNKQLIITIPEENKKLLAKNDDGSCNVSKEVPSSLKGGFCPEKMKCFVDFDNAHYDFRSTNVKENLLSEVQRLNLSKSEKRQGVASQSFVSSKSRDSPDSMFVQRDSFNFAELPNKDDASPTLPGSSFAEHIDDVLSNHEANRYGQGNESNITDQQKEVHHRSTSQENMVKIVPSETEVEVSFNEYLTTTVSQESTEVSNEDLPKKNKGSESFPVGLLRRSFRDFSRSNQHMKDEKPNVSVNGQPIPNHVVKKVEKLAGPIQAGDYWYDCQAGFWGVMGQPCLGIIPSFIKEFHYPMTRNCAAGNTSVIVNGRELHQKDLDLLASRGLPTTKDKFYIIEISGRVYDKDSGKELNGLGKLAPTIQKLKRGFGMKVPRKL